MTTHHIVFILLLFFFFQHADKVVKKKIDRGVPAHVLKICLRWSEAGTDSKVRRQSNCDRYCEK